MSKKKREHPRWTADRVRVMRNFMGLSQPEFAARVGVSAPTTVSLWETGKRPPDRRSLRALDTLAFEEGFDHE